LTRYHPSAAGQEWNADGYARHAGFVPELGSEVLELLGSAPGEAILDLGCGDGVLTERIVAAGAAVTGLEADPDMAAHARARGLTVLEQDAHQPFGSATYDAVFSNAALHWMRDPPRVLRNIRAALKPGGRVVAEQGGFGNVAAVVTALCASLEAAGHSVPPSPWDFPTPTAQRARLEAAGFEVATIALISRPTPLPTGIAGWLATFGAPFMPGLDAAARAAVFTDTERRLAHLRDETGTWYADYMRLRFAARAV
jgi:SAM-dependent methyltransferase